MKKLTQSILTIAMFVSFISLTNCGQTHASRVASEKLSKDSSAGANFDETTGEQPENLIPLFNEGKYFSKCAYTLRGEKGAIFKVERLAQQDDQCQAETLTVKSNNPKATIVSMEHIFTGYHDDGTYSPYYWRCNFTLQGEKGAVWKVQRHLKFDDNCATAEATVKTNNPKAIIVDRSETFLGYHDDGTSDRFYWKCVYKLQGAKGAQWNVERFLKFRDGCQTANATVKANNPNASILSEEEVFVGYQD